VHEAGHAVVHALGGACVYRVAVAPVGAVDWSPVGRKGNVLSDLWGFCEPAGSPAAMFLRWDEDEGGMVADKATFRRMLQMLGTRSRGGRRETLRQVRAHVCGLLAGPAAEQLFQGVPGRAVDLFQGEFGRPDDIAIAEAHCWLLHQRNELERMARATIDALSDPATWGRVLLLADVLDLRGEVEDEELGKLLPDPVAHWPQTARVSQQAPRRLAGSAA
jgi:hypothetical protein